MSVVVWDGKTLAADRQAEYGNVKYTTKKLWKIPNGDIVATVGQLDIGLTMKRWYESGAKREDWPKCQEGEDFAILIVVSRLGCFFYESLPEAIEVLDSIRAWGAGKEVALGAMEMGADAVKAVEVASKYVSTCGMGCDFARSPAEPMRHIREPKKLKLRKRSKWQS